MASPEKQMAWGYGICYSFFCVIVALVFSMILNLGISDSYGGEREPSYDEAARMAGYFDSNGVYQGGQPSWGDWSEDSYSCGQASQNEKYCQAWTTDRYYSDPEQEFLKGNCTCIRPLDDAVELTFDVWNSLHEDSQTTSSSGAALQDAEFCSAWNCHETRYTQECICTAYETQTSCRRRQLRNTGGSGGSSCTTTEVCVAHSCEYIESNFYTACDCDSNGQRRAEWGPDWWREFTHCEEFSCHHSSVLVTMNESFALSSSATEFASLPPENVSLVPINPTVVSGHLDQVWAMDYACTQTQGNGSMWCGEWRGITGEEDAEVVEQLCGCTDQDAGNSGEFCGNWTCTTYYMDACQVCGLSGVGISIAVAILMCLAPLYSCVARGHIAQPILATPFGVGASSLAAVFFGGWTTVWSGVVPGFFVSVFVGWWIGNKRPGRIDPQAETEAKDHQEGPTPLQTPIPVTGGLGSLSQPYQQTVVTAGPGQQPSITYGVTAGAYSYTPPGGQQQPLQYSAPTSPGGYNPPASYAGGWGNQRAYGGGFQAGVPNGAPPPNQYGYQNPPQFKTGVGGAHNGY